MNFRLLFQPEAEEHLGALKRSPGLAARHKAVCRCLGYLETNPRHPGHGEITIFAITPHP